MRHAPPARADPGIYPERQAERLPALDRMLGELAFRARLALGRELAPRAELSGEVARHAERCRGGDLAAQAKALRYRLRRDGLQGERLAESFGMAWAALSPQVEPPAAPALDAAVALVHGRSIVDLADAEQRWQALALAACAFALCGVPVHLFTASEARAREAAQALRPALAALGLQAASVTHDMGVAERRSAYAAPVVCGPLRTIAMDYLRDRTRLGRRQRSLQARLERVAGAAPADGELLLGGLRCALVEDADLTLVDDSRLPMVVSSEGAAADSADRLLYEQALELARALEAPADFAVADGAASLQPRGAQRLAQLSMVLGGVWAPRQAREALVAQALTALHAMQRGRDYEVAGEALQFPGDAAEQAPEPALARLLEIKEGLPFGGRQVLARLSVPSFFRRYLRLAGTCFDAAGLERELWSLYGLTCRRAGGRLEPRPVPARLFAAAAARRAALAVAAHEQAANGRAVLVAVRSVKEGEAVAAALHEAGLQPALVQGGGQGLDALERAGAVLLSLHPAQRSVARLASAAVPLHLIVAEPHDAARHVAQIARAYAAGSSEQFLALEDAAVALGLGPLAVRRAGAAAGTAGEASAALAARAARQAQRAGERAAARARMDAAAREQSLEDLLAFSGRGE